MILWKWLKRSVYYILLIALLLAIAGTSYQLIQETLDNRRYPPPGKFVDVGEYRLHYQEMGDGSPTVILDSGIGGSSIDWSLVQPKIAEFTRVISYDRSGYGWSDEVAEQRTGWEVAEDLNTLLEKANIDPPYILVGHSLGGVNMRLYASQYPEKVAGMVLVDPPHEQLEELSPEPPEEMNVSDPEVLVMMSEMGIQRLLFDWTETTPKNFPQNTQKIWLAKHLATKQTRTALKESKKLESLLNELQPIESHINNHPLIVISSGKRTDLKALGLSGEWDDYAEKRYQTLRSLHEELVSKAPNGKQVIAEESDHMIPWNQPQVIVDAVHEVVDEVRAQNDLY
jgi:pimeloyl-ACP methyl ester carboxylesterase